MASRRAATETARAAPRFAHLLPQVLKDSSPSAARLMRLHTVAHHAAQGAGSGAGAHFTEAASGVPLKNLPTGGWRNMSTWEVPISTAEVASAQASSAQASASKAVASEAAAAAEGAAAARAPGHGPWGQSVQGAAHQVAQQGVEQAAQQAGQQPQRYHSMCRARWYASSAEGRTPPFFWRRRHWPFDSPWARTSEHEWGLLGRGPSGAPLPEVQASGRPPLSPFSDPLAWAQEVTRELTEAAAAGGRVLGKPWGVQEAAEEFRFKFGLPGVGKDGVRVRIQDSNILTVEAKQQLEEKGGSWAAQTESWFQRKLRLPEGVKPQDVSAEMKDGVLTVKVPKVQPSPQEGLAMDVPIA